MKSEKSTTEQNYLVCISKKTLKNWGSVVEALELKHKSMFAGVLTYESSPEECVPELSKILPYYTCFVTAPSECTKEFISVVVNLTTILLPGPYSDTIWGILTGPDEQTALNIAKYDKELVIKTSLSNCPFPIENCQSGIIYSEINQCVSYLKIAEKSEREEIKCPGDVTSLLVEHLNCKEKSVLPVVDLLITSGHATERDWNIGFCYKGGRFIHGEKQNKLLAQDVKGEIYEIDSRNPKVYIAAGNCLMGNIDDEQGCMALSWMKSANVMQMIGYTVPTWFGYGGWGILNYFLRIPGALTLAQAFFANLQTLITLGQREEDNDGYVHDFDVVTLYGDPAWKARIGTEGNIRQGAYFLDYNEVKTGEHQIIVKTNRAGVWNCESADDKKTDPGRPPICFFPRRLKNPMLKSGNAIVTSLFIVFDVVGAFEAGQILEATVREEL